MKELRFGSQKQTRVIYVREVSCVNNMHLQVFKDIK